MNDHKLPANVKMINFPADVAIGLHVPEGGPKEVVYVEAATPFVLYRLPIRTQGQGMMLCQVFMELALNLHRLLPHMKESELEI